MAKSIMGTTEADPLSIMCYEIPGEITKDRKAIRGGTDINSKDFAFAGKVYPITRARPASPAGVPMPVPVSDPVAAPRESLRPQEADTFHIVIMDEFDPEHAAREQEPADADSKSDAKRPKFARVFASYGGARSRVPCV